MYKTENGKAHTLQKQTWLQFESKKTLDTYVYIQLYPFLVNYYLICEGGTHKAVYTEF